MKCKNCKFNNNAEAKFCVKCGSPIGEKNKKEFNVNISKKAIVSIVAVTGVILAFFLIKPLFASKVETVFVKGGTFTMGGSGSNKELKHKVTLNDFKISKYEITNEQYCEFLNEKGNQKEADVYWLDMEDDDCQIMKKDDKYVPKADKDKFSITLVSWYGAKAYCEWVGGRLPSEAEWEYAARGGNKTKGYKYAGSDNLDEIAWYTDNSDSKAHQVGTKKANELGLYDMSGNVLEWCSDWHDYDYYENSPKDNPKGPKKGTDRVNRGGSWHGSASSCRVVNRYSFNPTDAHNRLGFRPVFLP